MQRISFLFVALLINCHLIFGQEKEIDFDRISMDQGLSHNSVRSIVQDQKGFLWFGTEDGLNKYDGYGFTIYKHERNDLSSLSDNWITSIYETKSGTIWVGTNKGLNRFDKETETFTRFYNNPGDRSSLSNNSIKSIYEDKKGILWVGTSGGLNKLNKGKVSFTRYIHNSSQPNSISNNIVNTIYEDFSGYLWIGTNDGLNKFTRENNSFTHYKNNPGNVNSLSDNRVFSIYEEKSGTLWIGTFGGGLNQYVREKDNFIRYKHERSNPYSLSNDRVYSIFEDKSRTLWIGTFGGGLNKFDRDKNQFIHYKNEMDNPNSLSDNDVRLIYQDNSGTFWVGTEYGLNKFNLNVEKEKFVHYEHNPTNRNSLSNNQVFTIYEDKYKEIWIGTAYGLNRFDRKRKKFYHYKLEPKNKRSLSHNNVRTIFEDKYGSIWIGTYGGGLNRYNRRRNRFTRFVNDPHDPNNPTRLSHNRVKTIFEDRSGTLWIGTNGGLNRYDRNNNKFQHFKHNRNDPNSLSHNQVSVIYEAKNGIFWIGTSGGGLNKFDPKEGQFSSYKLDKADINSLSHNTVTTIFEDEQGSLWIGTHGGGLNELDRKENNFTRFTKEEGLPSDDIFGILGDKEGNLWLSTSNGISKFNLQTQIFRNYDVNDGLQSNEFNTGAFHKNKNGEMFFGGVNGFNSFFPEKIKDNPHIPPIVLTGFKILDRPVIFDKAISEIDKIELSYKDNFFSFEFAALDFAEPEKNYYAYMMKGLDEDWINLGPKRTVSYRNLSQGVYYFRVKGSNNDRVWNKEGIEIKISVIPPFWQTWWFRIIAGVTILGIAFTWYGMRIKNVESQKRNLEIQVAERTYELENKTEELESALENLKKAQAQLIQVEKMSALGQMVAGIAHEMNTPLGYVKSNLFVAAKAIEKQIVPPTRSKKRKKKYYDVIHMLKSCLAGTDRLGDLVVGLRNFSRLDDMDKAEIDMTECMESTLLIAKHVLEDHNVKVKKNFQPNVNLNCYGAQLNQVFLNIITNAAQAMSEFNKDKNGKIKNILNLYILQKDGKVIIKIKDNGGGIQKKIRDKIFDPFFTTKPVGQGTGLGLSISYQIVEKHNGSIEVNIEENVGSEFIVIFPQS